MLEDSYKSTELGVVDCDLHVCAPHDRSWQRLLSRFRFAGSRINAMTRLRLLGFPHFNNELKTGEAFLTPSRIYLSHQLKTAFPISFPPFRTVHRGPKGHSRTTGPALHAGMLRHTQHHTTHLKLSETLKRDLVAPIGLYRQALHPTMTSNFPLRRCTDASASHWRCIKPRRACAGIELRSSSYI